MREIIIKKEEENQRLDKFLFKLLNDAPKTFVYKMLRKKNIKLNGLKAAGSEILACGDVLNLYFSDETISKFSSEKEVNFSAGNLEIVYEDDNILAINKPKGVLSHPDNGEKNSVVDQVLLYLHKKGEYDVSANSTFTPGIVNRLDRNTTGLMLAGKNLAALQGLNGLFREKEEIEKYYLAIVKGNVQKAGKLTGYHVKNAENNKVFIHGNPVEGSSFVNTEYEPVFSCETASFIRIKLITGKSHQIRAHLSHVGNPILGDNKYGSLSFNKKYKIYTQLLHSEKIVFKTSYLSEKNIQASLPSEFKNIANQIFGGIL